MTRTSDAELERWRKLDVGDVVRIIAPHAVMDATFVPVKARNSRRWHVCVGARHFELVATGSRFFDTRSRVGGAGAVAGAGRRLGALRRRHPDGDDAGQRKRRQGHGTARHAGISRLRVWY